MIYFIGILIAYLIGSIPVGYIFGKVLKGVDIRQHGSGNVGATNVFRVVGKGAGIVVLFLDGLKGYLAVKLIPVLLPGSAGPEGEVSIVFLILLGSAAVAGHIWTVFLKFKGGKGVATTAGIMIALAPGVFLGGLIVWVLVFFVSKYVSLASMCAAVSLPIISLVTGKSLSFIFFASILCMVGVWSHRSNIKRLIQGAENKIVKTQKSH